ncbi:5-formyltetrahydrofolate cyclo-ligase [Sphingomonas sp. Leaf339]|uniref:5-formyltetrahydrofolate cyclo-ligase n=1 Tax=Sphingomonas sp. Leaf339 TaxID=1736343 RepID=UPI0006FFF919|nr:5-formyltetrahydrofolate cyclo-ligase [Sphingomonas sp. Leaf339]KQU62349.1 5-formyltetrahydrofolate cyclo-ligase [Sphingomonas sp. Leaf339]
MMGKRALRARLRAIRDAAPPASMVVPDAFAARLSPGLIVASYIAMGGEADPAPLDRVAADAGCRLALPHVVDRPTPIRFLDARRALVDGPFGLRQPDAGAAELAPDIILTPLVGFDRRGNRLGQGAGHYDRAFAAYPAAWRIGIAHAAQEVPSLTPDPWDVPLHAILTEQEWIVP